MTENELNKLHFINKEIGVLKRQLEELKSRSLVKGQEITDMPFASGTSDKTGDRAIAIREIEEMYEIKLKELYLTRAKIERYIDIIDDPEVRLIVRLRCINNMNWDEIGDEVGMDRRTASRKYFRHTRDIRNLPTMPIKKDYTNSIRVGQS